VSHQSLPSSRTTLTRKGVSVVGRRKKNEDSHAFFEPADASRYARKGSLVVVADGMGGHAGGEVASLIAVNVVREEYANDPEEDITRSLARAVRAANAAIFKRSMEDPSLYGMGTTCTAVVLRGDEATFAHVGDSRAYLVRKRQIHQLTRDHSLGQGGDDDQTFVGRRADAHVLTRALGAEETVSVDTPATAIRVEKGDQFVVCSDGLSKVLPDSEFLKAVLKHEPADACDHLVALAMERGGTDNITVEILRVDAVPRGAQGGALRRWWGRLRGRGGQPPRRSTSQIVVARSTPHEGRNDR